ncbi:MAG: transporter substrate-binding domain-containing protein [Bacteroides sp.]|nr:transporter substrate-binding domain-containing protein [Bacteroides sp.]
MTKHNFAIPSYFYGNINFLIPMTRQQQQQKQAEKKERAFHYAQDNKSKVSFPPTRRMQKVLGMLLLLTGFSLTTHVVEEVTLRKITAGIFVSPPFVMTGENGEPEGMAIDLWKIVAEPLNLVTEYREYPTLELLIKALQKNEIEIILTNLTVSYERAQLMKFSFP